MIIDSRTFARAGLLGNPSDGYFGKTISIIVKNFGAHVQLYQSPELVIEPNASDLHQFRNIYALRDAAKATGYSGGIPLIKAAIKKFCEFADQESLRLPNRNFTIRYSSNIPRQVGLAGSSAIVIATLKALIQFYEVDIPPHLLATLALEAETKELGITAGLQDRVIQAYEGCVYMDFEKAHMQKNGYGRYDVLNPALLPKLYLAYKTDLSKVSGKVLNDIKTRYEQEEKHVIDTLAHIASLAEQGKQAILKEKTKRLGELIDENFDSRCKIMNISDSNMELVNTARACGVSAKFTGSGGSIIGTYPDEETLKRLVFAMKKIQARVIKPIVL